jgi:hypothetical protein
MAVYFPELAQLLEHDQDKMVRVLQAFYRSASKDLCRLEQAAVVHEWQTVRGMAHRLHISCLHVGERDAADAAAALASIPGEFFAELYDRRRPLIVGSVQRAEEFLNRATSARKSLSDSSGETRRE